MSARSAILPLCLALLAVGCNFGLDSPTLVKTPRILAIVAEPPEAAPGEDVAISVMAFDPMGRDLTYSFRLCVDPSAALDQGSLGTGDVPCFPLVANDFRTTIPGSQTLLLANAVEHLTPEQTGGFDPAVLIQILDTAGLPVSVRVDVVAPDGEILVSGFKLVGITRRDDPTHNPPPPALFVDGVPYVGGLVEERPFDCVRPVPQRVLPDATVSLRPGDDSDTWVETFPIYDFTGGVRTGHEGGYYSFYATGGVIGEETTQHPDEEGSWHSPAEEGTYRLWYIVRDGHLGTSACTFELEVRAE